MVKYSRLMERWLLEENLTFAKQWMLAEHLAEHWMLAEHLAEHWMLVE